MSEVEIKHTTLFSHMIIPNTNKTQIWSQIRKPLLNLPLIGAGRGRGGSLFNLIHCHPYYGMLLGNLLVHNGFLWILLGLQK